jgi:hypothetical protein
MKASIVTSFSIVVYLLLKVFFEKYDERTNKNVFKWHLVQCERNIITWYKKRSSLFHFLGLWCNGSTLDLNRETAVRFRSNPPSFLRNFPNFLVRNYIHRLSVHVSLKSSSAITFYLESAFELVWYVWLPPVTVSVLVIFVRVLRNTKDSIHRWWQLLGPHRR